MADFSTGIDVVAGSQVARSAPVASPSAVAEAVPLISTAVKGIAGAFFDNAEAQRKVDHQAAIDANLNAFSQSQLKLANAVDTGDMSSAEARMRQRANYTAAIANNPSLISQFAEIQKSLTTTAGLAKNVADGTDAENMELANQKAASSAGWIPPTATPDQRTQLTQEYLRFQRSQADLEASAKQLSYQRAQIGLQSDKVGLQSAQVNLQSAKLGLQQRQQEQQANIALGNLTDAYNTKFGTNLQTIQDRYNKGELTQEDAIKLIDQQHQVVMQTASQIGQNAGGGRVANLTAPITEMANNAKKYISGEMTKDLLETKNLINIGQQKLLITSNPEDSKIIAVSQLLQAAAPVLMSDMSNAVVKIIGKNYSSKSVPANPHPDSPQEQRDNKTYLNVLKSGLSQLNSGGLNDNNAGKQEIETHANQVLKGVSAYSMSVEDPSHYNDVVDFLASPEYGKYAATKGGVPADQAVAAKQVIQQQYEQAVLPLLQKEYDSAVVGSTVNSESAINSGRTVSQGDVATKVIHPMFTGSGISFTVDPSAPNKQAAMLKAKDLNARVAPVVNRLIRMSAHRSGSQNYKSVYDSQYAAIFGEEQPKGE